MTNYSAAFKPSFGSQVFSNESGASLKNFDFGQNVNPQFTGGFGVDTAGQFNSVADALTGTGALAGGGGWSFITAPEDISWDVTNQASRIDIFGTNNPPVVAGSRGMRDLSLGNSLVEGFVRGVTVEGKIAALENLMNYTLNQTDGFVSVPVYQVTANDKIYGNGYFIIRDVKVKEKMRDLKGNATRAYVDISLMEVPEYQVNTGRDQASKVAASATSVLSSRSKDGTTAQQQAAQRNSVNSTVDKNLTPGNRSGATGPSPGGKKGGGYEGNRSLTRVNFLE
jgi:hypothetical protein